MQAELFPATTEPAFSVNGATISRCGLYRYTLHRRWGERRRWDILNYIMLNPSTADATADDPTITRCVERAKRLGFGAIVVTNLFAFRATQPADMKRAADPIGPENDNYLLGSAATAGLVILGWGNHGSMLGRDKAVRRMLGEAGIRAYALDATKAGQPQHPLYVGYDKLPRPMPPIG